MIAWTTRRFARCWNHFDGFAAVSHTSQTQQPISCIACVPLLRIGFFLWVFLCFFQGGISLHFCIVPDSPKVCTSEVWVLWPVRSRALQPWTSWGQFHKLWQWSAGRLSSNQVLPRPSRIWSTSASQNSTSLPLWRNTGLTPPASLWSTIWSLPQSRSSNNKCSYVGEWVQPINQRFSDFMLEKQYQDEGSSNAGCYPSWALWLVQAWSVRPITILICLLTVSTL